MRAPLGSTIFPRVHERVDHAVDDLDATITEIRTAIFELGETLLPDGLRHAVVQLAEELTPTLGTRPELRFVGPVDNAVPPQVADHILAVVREALTNAAKHARATRCSVEISVTDDVVLVAVIDNGRASRSIRRLHGHGLTNLRQPGQKVERDLRDPLGRRRRYQAELVVA